MQLYAVHLDTPLVGGIVEHGTQFGVDGVAAGECLVEFQFTNNVTQGCLREFLDSVGQVINLINSFEWVNNLEIQQCIDLRLHIILGNHILLVEVIDLLTQINVGGVEITPSTVSDNALGLVNKRDNHIDTGTQRGMILAKTLNDLGLALRDNHKALFHDDERKQYERYQYIGCYCHSRIFLIS